MKTFRESFKISTPARQPWFEDINEQVVEIVKKSGIQNGLVLVFSHHTTCSVILQEYSKDITYNGLEFMNQDLVDVFEKIIPIIGTTYNVHKFHRNR